MVQRTLRTVGACGIAVGVAVLSGGAIAGAATTTTTAGGSTTTSSSTTSTTVPIKQVKVHGTATDQNSCPTSLVPALKPPTTYTIPVTLSADAFPQPHEGDKITLTNTTATIAVPASVLQQGVDLGLITNGLVVPSVLTVVVNGAGTTEGTHSYSVNSTATVVVINGQAQPLKASVSLPNTTWTPKNSTDPVFFSEKSLTIVSTLAIAGGVTATFACDPSTSPSFIALSAQGTAPPTTTTVATTPTTVAPATTVAVTPVTAAATTLPRTGGSSTLPVAIGGSSLALGLVALVLSSRKRRVTV